MNKRDLKERVQCNRRINQARAAGREIVGREFQNDQRVRSNGVGMLAVPAGTVGTIVARYPGEEWKEDMSGWTGRLEWLYSVRWDDRSWNNPSNQPSGCSHEMLEPIEEEKSSNGA